MAPANLIVEMHIKPKREGATAYFDRVLVEGVDAAS